MRKTRTDNILRSLSPEAQAEVARIGESMTLAEAVEQLALPEEMGGFEVEVSPATLSKFLSEWRAQNFRAKLKEAAATAAEVEGALTPEDSGAIDSAILGGVREWILDSIVQRQISAKEAKSLIGLIQTSKKHELEERKIAMLERKAEAFDALEKAAEAPGGLTPETLSQIREKAGLL